jgi:hypothetical protein
MLRCPIKSLLVLLFIGKPAPHLDDRIQVAAVLEAAVVGLPLGGWPRLPDPARFLELARPEKLLKGQPVVVDGGDRPTRSLHRLDRRGRRPAHLNVHRLLQVAGALCQELDAVFDRVGLEDPSLQELVQRNRIVGIDATHIYVRLKGGEVEGCHFALVSLVGEPPLGQELVQRSLSSLEERPDRLLRFLALVASAARLAPPGADAPALPSLLVDRAGIVLQHVQPQDLKHLHVGRMRRTGS